MRELNACLKLNFLSRKVPILVGIVLLGVLCIELKRNNFYITIGNVYMFEALFLMVYSGYNYKNSFLHWIGMGGRRRVFYLNSFIFFIFTAAVIAYVQTLVFIHYASQNQMIIESYGNLNLMEAKNFKPLVLWFYHFMRFIASVCVGSFFGVLNIKHDSGEALGLCCGYFFGFNLVYMFLIKIFEGTILNFITSSITYNLLVIVIYGISLYISWRVITKQEDVYMGV